MCTVRGVPTNGISNFHTLLLEVPHIVGCRMLLKMLSISEKSRWDLNRLTLVTEESMPKVNPKALHLQIRFGLNAVKQLCSNVHLPLPHLFLESIADILGAENFDLMSTIGNSLSHS